MRCVIVRCAVALVLSLCALAMGAQVVDDFEAKGNTSRLGFAYASFTDGFSILMPVNGIDYADGVSSASAGRFAFQMKTGGQAAYAGVVTMLAPGGAARDVAAFAGVRCRLRGSGIVSVAVATSETMKVSNHYHGPDVELSADWQLVEIPFSSMAQTWGAKVPFELKHATAIQFTVVSQPPKSGEVVIDQLEFFTDAEMQVRTVANPIVAGPKVNQVGFIQNGPKRFTIEAGSAGDAGAFSIEDVGGKSVFVGQLQRVALDDTASTGERVLRADFDTFTQVGRYRVVVNGQKSPMFTISAAPYRDVYHDAARAFYIIRSGIALDDARTGLRHPLSHAGDAIVKLADAAPVQRDLAGGWYNAGDFGKWTHMIAISSSYMMLLQELKGEQLAAVSLDIPESGNAISDLLDQARWGLTWLLKMQNADGSVLHKVDSGANFCFGTSPDKDPNERYGTFASSIDAGVFTGVMMQASRVFAQVDPVFAARCKSAGLRSWAWLKGHPNVKHSDPFYVDDDADSERLWAAAGVAQETGDPAAVELLNELLRSRGVRETSWQEPGLLGLFTFARDAKTDAAARVRIREQVLKHADQLREMSEASGYGVAMKADEYAWESLENVFHRAAVLIMAAELSGEERYRVAAIRQLDYALGNNSLGLSFVTGHGERAVTAPFHWTHAALGKALPGWAAGGPNRNAHGADALLIAVQQRGTPPAKCFVDGRSWASNEGETSENAALVFLAGYFTDATPAR